MRLSRIILGAVRSQRVAVAGLALAVGLLASTGGGLPDAVAGGGCYLLTKSVGSGSGSVTNMPSSAGPCPLNQYPLDYMVAVVAEPASGYVWSYWSGTDWDFSNPTTVTMSSNRSVTAYFTSNCFTVTTNVGTGSGSVSKSPSSAGGCPSGRYPMGYPVTLTANPAPAYRFSSWSGTDNNGVNPTTVTISGNENVTANFAWNCYTLTKVIGSGSGSINSTPSSAGGCPTNQYTPGTQVTLLAKPASGSFLYWTGTANNGANPSYVMMNGNRTVTAFFTGPPAPTPTRTRTATPTKTPTITPTPTITNTPTPKDPNGDTDGDTLLNPVDLDDDNDGCTDLQELGADQTLGGRREPHVFWDVFDTPAGSPPGKDRIINISDVGAVVARFGASGDPGIDPLSPPPANGYHTAFDRNAPAPGAELWDLRSANGSISVVDIGAVVAQFGHTCSS